MPLLNEKKKKERERNSEHCCYVFGSFNKAFFSKLGRKRFSTSNLLTRKKPISRMTISYSIHFVVGYLDDFVLIPEELSMFYPCTNCMKRFI